MELRNTCSALLLAALFAGPASASSERPAAPASGEAVQSASRVTADKRKQITAEAMAAVAETRGALEALDRGRQKNALAALERAAGKLEIILAREPKLALAPVDVAAATYDVVADVEKVRQLRKDAERLLDDGQVQAARYLLEGLASETVVSVSSIPLATYPAAIKEAARLIDAGKTAEAKATLETALATLVVSETVLPLPVTAAQEALTEAEALAEKAGRSEADSKRLSELLAQARGNLEFAQVLGYGTKKDYKALHAELDQIEEKTRGSKHGAGLFARIKSSLAGLFDERSREADKASRTASSGG